MLDALKEESEDSSEPEYIPKIRKLDVFS